MTAGFDRLLTSYEAGKISRRELLGALTALAAAVRSATAAQPAVGPVSQLNHVTVYVQDVRKSVEFYQQLFGMPVLTPQEPGVNLRAGSGFFGIYPAQGRPTGIDHVCFGLERFDADAVVKKLAAAGVKGTIRLRGDTKELHFTDADNVHVQLQDVRYRGGIGPLGDGDPK